MPVLYAGARLDREPGPKYVAALPFAEIALRAPLPRAGTLAKWRSTLPDGFRLALVAPRTAVSGPDGPLRPHEALDRAVAWLVDAAAALGVHAIVVPTGADVTTGQRDRDRLAAYFDRLRGDGTRAIVWAPGGLWAPEEAVRAAARLGVLYSFDPLDPEAEVPDGPTVYARLHAMGARRRFGESLLYEVCAKVYAAAPAEVYVAIESGGSFREAVRLAQIAAEAARIASGEGDAEPAGASPDLGDDDWDEDAADADEEDASADDAASSTADEEE